MTEVSGLEGPDHGGGGGHDPSEHEPTLISLDDDVYITAATTIFSTEEKVLVGSAMRRLVEHAAYRRHISSAISSTAQHMLKRRMREWLARSREIAKHKQAQEDARRFRERAAQRLSSAATRTTIARHASRADDVTPRASRAASPTGRGIIATRAQMEALEQDLDAVRRGAADDRRELKRELTRVAEAHESLADELVDSAQATQLALNARVADVEAKNQLQVAELRAALDALGGRVAELEAAGRRGTAAPAATTIPLGAMRGPLDGRRSPRTLTHPTITPRGRVSPHMDVGTVREEGEEDADDDKRSAVGSHAGSHAGSEAPERVLGIAKMRDRELDMYSCDMTREQIKSKLSDLRDDLMGRHPAIKTLLAEGDSDDAVAALIQEDVDVRAASDFCMHVLNMVVKRGTDAADVFVADERDLRRTDPDEYDNARAKLARMMVYGLPYDERGHRTRMQELLDRQYLRTNMDKTKARAAIVKLRDDLHEIPPSERVGVAKDPIRLLISKIPTDIRHDTRRSWQQALEDEMDQWERDERARMRRASAGRGRGRGKPVPETIEPKWDWKQLTEDIVARVCRDERPGSANFTLRNGQDVPCIICGKKTCKKGAKDCKIVGPCGVLGCGCAGGYDCLMMMENMPKREGSKRGDGQQYNKKVWEGLVQEHERFAPKRAAAKKRLAAVVAEGDEPPAAPAASAPATSATGKPKMGTSLMLCSRGASVAMATVDADAAPYVPQPIPTRKPGTGLAGGLVCMLRSRQAVNMSECTGCSDDEGGGCDDDMLVCQFPVIGAARRVSMPLGGDPTGGMPPPGDPCPACGCWDVSMCQRCGGSKCDNRECGIGRPHPAGWHWCRCAAPGAPTSAVVDGESTAGVGLANGTASAGGLVCVVRGAPLDSDSDSEDEMPGMAESDDDDDATLPMGGLAAAMHEQAMHPQLPADPCAVCGYPTVHDGGYLAGWPLCACAARLPVSVFPVIGAARRAAADGGGGASLVTPPLPLGRMSNGSPLPSPSIVVCDAPAWGTCDAAVQGGSRISLSAPLQGPHPSLAMPPLPLGHMSIGSPRPSPSIVAYGEPMQACGATEQGGSRMSLSCPPLLCDEVVTAASLPAGADSAPAQPGLHAAPTALVLHDAAALSSGEGSLPPAVAPHAMCMLTLTPARHLPGGVLMIRVLVDTGADTFLVAHSEAANVAKSRSAAPSSLEGLGGEAVSNGVLNFVAAPVGWRHAHAMRAHDVSGNAGRPGVCINVASHKGLVRDFNARVRYEDEMVITSASGCTSEIEEVDDLYWAMMIIGSSVRRVREASMAMHEERHGPMRDASMVAHVMAVMAATARARVHDPRHLKAVRYGVDAEQLVKLDTMVAGLNVGGMSRDSAVLINSDTALRRSRHTRPASAGVRNVKALVLLPAGHTFAADVVALAVACMTTGAEYTFHAVCVTGDATPQGTGFVYSVPTHNHTEEDWYDFFQLLIIAERVHKHDVRRIIGDCESCLRDDAACRRLSLRLNCLVERAGGDDHEKIGGMEGIVKSITRRTEMAMYRAKSCVPPVPDGMMGECRLYQAGTLNCLFKDGSSITRTQAHTGLAPSERSVPRISFWTDCSVQTIGQQAGPKGLMDDDRSSHERLGRMLGISSASDGRPFAKLWCLRTRKVLSRDPKALLPHDEQVILNAGVAMGVAIADATVQVDDGQLQPLALLAPPAAAAPRIVEKIVHRMPAEQLPVVGSDVRVLWQDHVGQSYHWHQGKCTDVRQQPPPVLHQITYPGSEPVWHDLAKDMATGAHPWVLEAAEPAPAPAAVPPTRAAPPVDKPSARTRSRTAALVGCGVAAEAPTAGPEAVAAQRMWQAAAALAPAAASQAEQRVREAARVRAHHVWSLVERMDMAIESSETPEAVHDALVEQAFGDAGDYYTTRQCGSLEAARARLYAVVRDSVDGDEMCAVASAMLVMTAAGANSQCVRITNPDGTYSEQKTPRTCREMLGLPDCVEWLRAARDAIHLSIMSLPGNHIISESEGAAMGLPIAEMVTTCKYKLDELGRLVKRKVRHSWDEARQVRTARGEDRAELLLRACYTLPIGDAEQCALLATATPSDNFTLIDWKDAYGLGICARGIRLVRPPPELDIRTPSGERALLAIVTSLWGEGPAGFEWEARRHEMMAHAGWHRVHDVPAIYYQGEHRAGVIIDDMLVRTRDPDGPPPPGEVPPAAAALILSVNAAIVPLGGAPLVVTVDVRLWGGMLLTRSPCRQVITSSLPSYIESVAVVWLPGYLEAGTLPPGTLRGDKLKQALDAMRPAAGDGALTKQQRDVMSIAQVIRWISQRVTRVLRYSHLISRVQHRSPPEAMACALGTLALACDHRYEGRSWGLAVGDSHCRGVLQGTKNDQQRATVRVADGPAKLRDGAPVQLEGSSDVNWGLTDASAADAAANGVDLLLSDVGCLDTVAYAVTCNGGALVITLANAGVTAGSSAEGEGFGLLKLADKTVYLRTVVARCGMPQDGPTILLCDAVAALRVAAGESSAARLRHALRRSSIVTQRVRDDELALAHMPDACQVVDFLTKWVEAAKEEASLAYLCNFAARAAVEGGAGAERAAAVIHMVASLGAAYLELER